MRIPVFRRFRGLILQENETIEDLQLNGLRLIQTKNGFRYGMDTVLLAHFANIRESDIVADFGTGSGILRQLIRQYLATIPNVSKFRDEHVQFGGAGITVVDLS